MKRILLPAMAFAAILLGASAAHAAQFPQRIETRPYAGLYTPPEAVTSAVGGPGVVLAEAAKSTVVYQMTEGGPCGPSYDSSAMTNSGRPGSESEGSAIWLPVGIIAAAVVGLGLVGFWLLRRARV